MALNPIPEGSVEIQTGLWAYEYHYRFNGRDRMRYRLYSAEGYCFWCRNQAENYDEYGNLLPLEQRVFAQYAATSYTTIADLNAVYVSVPIQEGYENVSAGASSQVE